MKLLKEFVDAIRFVFREKKNLIYIEKFVVLQKKTTKKTLISKANKDNFVFVLIRCLEKECAVCNMFRYVIGIEKQINKKDITSNSGNLYSLFYLIRNTLKKIEVSWN